MSEWAAKRFWTLTGISALKDGYGVRLDGRPIRTPAKVPLVLPTRALAEAVAREWDAQDGVIDPQTMPLTRSANSAIDKVTPQYDSVAGIVSAYGDSDLLCYRAEGPEALQQRQAALWDPLLRWAHQAHAAPLSVTSGVMHVGQDKDSLARLDAAVRACSPWELTALHDLVALSGSLVIGLAAAAGAFPAAELWATSRVDELWQQEQWGEDDEATAQAALREKGFLQAMHFLELVRESD
ncbi:ATP12 family chaperone protein [Actibacterium ureilyticum]|uniref:ATP12 family chaperone protein n=1 Tax=Actibacterium ureilyticum TaxID=1590614 RepID=UPI000BAACA65|nr:ATP12 family protein [Actibacterium ureilyticum]